ncbi:TrmB family transcriptional regulator [Candidatus Thorarchaeota archaeon]|nr:MAG: TrmB family transcriptional regulator [Candidatus Thorarchaeota archaeon]
MEQDSVVEDLTRLGLAKNEAKAFRSLVKLGKSTASKIAEDSGIPRSKVYETLESLKNLGIIREELDTSPREFNPFPVESVIRHLEERVRVSANSSLSVLVALQNSRRKESKEFAWVLRGLEQMLMDMRTSIENAEEYVYIATAGPAILGQLRGAFSIAKNKGVDLKLFTTTPGSQEVVGLEHYLSINIAMPGSEVLKEGFKDFFQGSQIIADELEPTRMLIMNIDGRESIGVFLAKDETSQPWSLHVRSRLVVIIQWQVVKTILSDVEGIIQNKML